MAKYYIYRVRYKEEQSTKYIEEVQFGKSLTGLWLEKCSRSDVISDIESGTIQYMTTKKNVLGSWIEGESVHVITQADGDKFIRTDPNGKGSDNLENLPEY